MIRSFSAKKYVGLSLIEMLITIAILGFVLLIVAVTLTAMIKASAISNARTLSRNESDFIFEILKRHIENSEADEIYLYNTTGRSVTPGGDIIESGAVVTPVAAGSGIGANEIHIRPIGSNEWVCIALYPETGSASDKTGYVVKSSSAFQSTSCLNGTNPLIFINSNEVDVDTLSIKGYLTTSENYTFVIDLQLKPLKWAPGAESQFKPDYIRQLIVSTDKLTY